MTAIKAAFLSWALLNAPVVLPSCWLVGIDTVGGRVQWIGEARDAMEAESRARKVLRVELIGVYLIEQMEDQEECGQ